MILKSSRFNSGCEMFSSNSFKKPLAELNLGGWYGWRRAWCEWRMQRGVDYENQVHPAASLPVFITDLIEHFVAFLTSALSGCPSASGCSWCKCANPSLWIVQFCILPLLLHKPHLVQLLLVRWTVHSPNLAPCTLECSGAPSLPQNPTGSLRPPTTAGLLLSLPQPSWSRVVIWGWDFHDLQLYTYALWNAWQCQRVWLRE